jgi:hypothetical protein
MTTIIIDGQQSTTIPATDTIVADATGTTNTFQ